MGHQAGWNMALDWILRLGSWYVWHQLADLVVEKWAKMELVFVPHEEVVQR